VVIGDYSGSVESFRLKNGKLFEHVFKTLSGPNQKVTAVEVAGSGKIFVAVGPLAINGLNRKGKQFFRLELNDLTEAILHLKVKWPTDIFLCGHYTYNHFTINASPGSSDSGSIHKEDFYTCPARIVALTVIEHQKQLIPILASDDRLIRILHQSSCVYEVETSGIPSCLIPVVNADKHKTSFLYGSSDGRITMINVNDLSSQPVFQWEFPEDKLSVTPKASVECITMSKSGKGLVVGRSDGNIEVWSFDSVLNLDSSETVIHENAPVCQFTYNCNESITCINISLEENLLIVSTFSGSVFGLEWKGMVRRNISRQTVEDIQLRIAILKQDCSEIEATLVEERAKYMEGTESAQEGTSKSKKTSRIQCGVSALPTFAIKDSLVLQDDASYTLSLEVAVPIDVVILQSDNPIDVMDSEKNSAVVSFTDTDSHQVLVTFRCQSNTNRLEAKIRTVEGQYGNMRVYVISRVSPKTGQLKVYPLKPLSHHKRTYEQLTHDTTRETSRLQVTGDFSIHEAHHWVRSSLPEVPEKLVVPEEVTVYHFKSTLSSTFVSCQVSEGSVVFESDNVSTISILKDFITREATSRGIRIEVSTSIAPNGISPALVKLYPLVKRLVISREFNRLQAGVQELSRMEADVAEQLTQDLENDFKDRQHYEMISLDRLLGLITDLVIDEHKLRGQASKTTLSLIRNRVEQLLPTVESFFAKDDYANDSESFVQVMTSFWSAIDLT
jgi:Bardet-Biedl syndrome 7 protein